MAKSVSEGTEVCPVFGEKRAETKAGLTGHRKYRKLEHSQVFFAIWNALSGSKGELVFKGVMSACSGCKHFQ
jgi:hypothetical protein